MDDTGVKQRKTNSGDGGAKSGDKAGQKLARPKNTVSRIEGGKGLNTPKTLSHKTTTSPDDPEDGSREGSATGPTRSTGTTVEGDSELSDLEDAGPRAAGVR